MWERVHKEAEAALSWPERQQMLAERHSGDAESILDAIRLGAKPAILARERAVGAEVWWDGDEAHTLYTPDHLAYGFWRLVAREQAKARARWPAR